MHACGSQPVARQPLNGHVGRLHQQSGVGEVLKRVIAEPADQACLGETVTTPPLQKRDANYPRVYHAVQGYTAVRHETEAA